VFVADWLDALFRLAVAVQVEGEDAEAFDLMGNDRRPQFFGCGQTVYQHQRGAVAVAVCIGYLSVIGIEDGHRNGTRNGLD
jgi:hypothetical protein